MSNRWQNNHHPETSSTICLFQKGGAKFSLTISACTRCQPMFSYIYSSIWLEINSCFVKREHIPMYVLFSIEKFSSSGFMQFVNYCELLVLQFYFSANNSCLYSNLQQHLSRKWDLHIAWNMFMSIWMESSPELPYTYVSRQCDRSFIC